MSPNRRWNAEQTTCKESQTACKESRLPQAEHSGHFKRCHAMAPPKDVDFQLGDGQLKEVFRCIDGVQNDLEHSDIDIMVMRRKYSDGK